MKLTRHDTFENVLFRSAASLKHQNIKKTSKMENKDATVYGVKLIAFGSTFTFLAIYLNIIFMRLILYILELQKNNYEYFTILEKGMKLYLSIKNELNMSTINTETCNLQVKFSENPFLIK